MKHVKHKKFPLHNKPTELENLTLKTLLLASYDKLLMMFFIYKSLWIKVSAK